MCIHIHIYICIYIYTYARAYMYVYVSDNHILLPNILTYSGYKIYGFIFCEQVLKLVLPSVSTLRKCAVILTGYCSSRRARTKKTYFGFSDVFIIVNGFQLFPTRKKIHVILYHMMKWFRILFPPRILD